MTTSQVWGTSDMVSQLDDVLVRTPTTLGELCCHVNISESIDGLVDAVYMHDPMIMTPHDAILLRMTKPIRSGEPISDLLVPFGVGVEVEVHVFDFTNCTRQGCSL